MKEQQLLRAKQSLEAEPTAAPAAADADGAAAQQSAAGGGAANGRAQKRAKKADDYHGRHKDWVAQFNELTGGECAGGEAGVQWAAVRAWQQRHWQLNNLLADGLVGPKTIEAAKLLAKKNAPKQDKEEAGAAADGADKGKEKHDPQPGAAEGAESSADKPKLEEQDDDNQLAPKNASDGPQGAAAPQKQTTLPEFEAAIGKLEALLAQYKQPGGEGAKKPIAQHYVDGTDDKEAPPALGAMMSKEALRGYADAAKKLQQSWSSLGQPHARAQFLLDAVNEALAAEQVPAISEVKLAKMANPGQFTADSWSMMMNEPLFSSTAPKDIGGIASAVFHEGRHAEQRFSIARLLAEKITDPATLKSRAGVREDIAAKAIALRTSPLKGAQRQAAEQFEHATVDNPAHKNIEDSSAAITDAANIAATVFQRLPPADQTIAGARWTDVRQRTVVALEAYYQLATERDAFAAQKQLDAQSK